MPDGYKQPQRESTEARVREKDATAARRRNAELDRERDARIVAECDRLHCNDPIGPCDLCPQRETTAKEPPHGAG